MNNYKRILIISEAHLIRTFVQSVVEKLKEETDLRFDCFIVTTIDDSTRKSLEQVFDKVYANEYPRGIIRKIPKLRIIQTIYGLRKLAQSLGNYNIAHIHFHHFYYSFFTPIIRKKATKFFLTFFGSDFEQVEEFRHRHNYKTVKLLDGVFATNPVFLKRIIDKYRLAESNKTCDVLLPLMNSFKSYAEFLKTTSKDDAKEIMGFKSQIIVCGYNAAPPANHEVILNELGMIKDKLGDYQLVFPMTYGTNAVERRKMVKDKLNFTGLNGIILEEFLPINKIQALRLATDIFVFIPIRDQMASSMLEHLAAGSVMITGKWLPYDSLMKMGVYYILIDKPEDLSTTLLSVTENIQEHKRKCINNREIIMNMMSWDTIKVNWYKYYGINQKS